MGAVPLDEIHLQNESLKLGFHHHPFDMIDVPHQLPCFLRVPGVIDKIGFDPVAQVDGFANVYDFIVGIFHQVAAGLFGQGRKGVFNGFVYFDHFFRVQSADNG